MNPVVNQGKCQSCWAFAATASMEGMYAIKYGMGSKIKLSEQQLIDCSYANLGCKGGSSDSALKYLEIAGGQMR